MRRIDGCIACESPRLLVEGRQSAARSRRGWPGRNLHILAQTCASRSRTALYVPEDVLPSTRNRGLSVLGDFPSNAVLVVPSVVRNHLRVVADGTRSVQRLIAPIDVAVEVNESDGERLVEALEPALAGLPPLLR